MGWRTVGHCLLHLRVEASKDGTGGLDGRVHAVHVIHFIARLVWIIRVKGVFLVTATSTREAVENGVVVPALQRDGARIKAFFVDSDDLLVA